MQSNNNLMLIYSRIAHTLLINTIWTYNGTEIIKSNKNQRLSQFTGTVCRAPFPTMHLQQTADKIINQGHILCQVKITKINNVHCPCNLSFFSLCSSSTAWHKSFKTARQVEEPVLLFLLIYNHATKCRVQLKKKNPDLSISLPQRVRLKINHVHFWAVYNVWWHNCRVTVHHTQFSLSSLISETLILPITWKNIQTYATTALGSKSLPLITHNYPIVCMRVWVGVAIFWTKYH